MIALEIHARKYFFIIFCIMESGKISLKYVKKIIGNKRVSEFTTFLAVFVDLHYFSIFDQLSVTHG